MGILSCLDPFCSSSIICQWQFVSSFRWQNWIIIRLRVLQKRWWAHEGVSVSKVWMPTRWSGRWITLKRSPSNVTFDCPLRTFSNEISSSTCDWVNFNCRLISLSSPSSFQFVIVMQRWQEDHNQVLKQRPWSCWGKWFCWHNCCLRETRIRLPVIATIAVEAHGQSHNTIANWAESKIFRFLGAEKQGLMTDTEGRMLDHRGSTAVVHEMDIKAGEQVHPRWRCFSGNRSPGSNAVCGPMLRVYMQHISLMGAPHILCLLSIWLTRALVPWSPAYHHSCSSCSPWTPSTRWAHTPPAPVPWFLNLNRCATRDLSRVEIGCLGFRANFLHVKFSSFLHPSWFVPTRKKT